VDWIAPDVTDAGLLAIARNGALATLCLQTRFGLTDEGLRAAVSFCSHLQSVYLGCCGQIMDSTLVALGNSCHRLRQLDISGTESTDAGLRAIAAGCPLLERLVAFECDVGPALEAIARGCPRLRVLEVAQVELSPATLQTLVERCPQLQKVTLSYGFGVGDEEIAAMARGCPRLTQLTLMGYAVTEPGTSAIWEHCQKRRGVTADEHTRTDGRNDESFFPARVNVTFRSW
jgi:hypothetical protein